MKKQIFLLLFLYSFAYANSNTIEKKLSALKILKKYTQTIACSTNFDFENEKPLKSFLDNVFTIKRDLEYGEATYFVLWSGDKGCTGGSGTNSFYVSKIYRSDSCKPLLVVSDNAFGKALSGINTRFIDSIKQLGTTHFEVIASSFAKGDPNCCPSLKYQYTLLKKGQEWIMSSKKRLK